MDGRPEEITSVQVTKRQLARLHKKRVHERQPIHEVIQRLLDQDDRLVKSGATA